LSGRCGCDLGTITQHFQIAVYCAPIAGADAELRFGPEEAPKFNVDDEPNADVEPDPNTPPEDAPNAGAAAPAHKRHAPSHKIWLSSCHRIPDVGKI
jgi:hypothetical protein